MLALGYFLVLTADVPVATTATMKSSILGDGNSRGDDVMPPPATWYADDR